MILLLAVYVTPLHTIALHYLLCVHLLQNVVTAEWAPGLVVFGLAPTLAGRLEEFAPLRVVTHPLVALPLWLATYFVAGALMWWPVVHGRYSDGTKALYLFAAFLFAAPLGLLLALLPRPIYGFYKEAPQLWGLSDLTDQQIAGVSMAVEQAIVFFAVFAHFFTRFMRTEHVSGVFSGSPR